MSWLARSIANSLAADTDPTLTADNQTNSSSPTPPSPPEGQQTRGVKEDLSEIKNSLARQLRGVASFLAPPPPLPNSKTYDDEDVDESEKEDERDGSGIGIGRDFAEIRVKVKAGISKLLQSRNDDSNKEEGISEDYPVKSVIGVNEEVLLFVKDLVTHPRTWVRFPLPEDADADDFVLNESQLAHAGAVERQVPELADLRWELCPDYMSEGRFWVIYFVLVHPKLDKYDALTLSTPKINEARAMLTQESKHRRQVKQPEGSPVLSNVQDYPPPSMEPSVKDVPIGSSPADSAIAGASVEMETLKGNTPSDDMSAQNEAPATADQNHIKAVSNISSKVLVHGEDDDDNDADDWLNDETPNVDVDITRHIPINDDDDVSFSDLEEDDAPGPAKGIN